MVSNLHLQICNKLKDQKIFNKRIEKRLHEINDIKLYVVKESGQFSCREFRCLNVEFFLLKIVVFVFLGTVV